MRRQQVLFHRQELLVRVVFPARADSDLAGAVDFFGLALVLRAGCCKPLGVISNVSLTLEEPVFIFASAFPWPNRNATQVELSRGVLNVLTLSTVVARPESRRSIVNLLRGISSGFFFSFFSFLVVVLVRDFVVLK